MFITPLLTRVIGAAGSAPDVQCRGREHRVFALGGDLLPGALGLAPTSLEQMAAALSHGPDSPSQPL